VMPQLPSVEIKYPLEVPTLRSIQEVQCKVFGSLISESEQGKVVTFNTQDRVASESFKKNGFDVSFKLYENIAYASAEDMKGKVSALLETTMTTGYPYSYFSQTLQGDTTCFRNMSSQ